MSEESEALITTSSQLTREEILADLQEFYDFITKIILPFEPQQFKAHAQFHKRLMYTACLPISATAAPRGFLKSTIFARYRPLYRIVTGDNTHKQAVDFLLLSCASDLVCAHLDWIKRHVEFNPHLMERYGQLKPPHSENRPWNQDEIELTNGNRCQAIGYKGAVRGKHPTDIVVDDLESEDNAVTPEAVKKLKDWFYRVIIGAMDPETRITVIGTIIDRKGLLTELLSKPEFQGVRWKALNTNADGTQYSLWDDRWPVAQLLRKKGIQGTHRFNAEMQNEPLASADPIILEEWVQRHTMADLGPLRILRRYIGVDPAFTEERWGDYSAIFVLDQASNGRLYERLAWRKKVTGPALRNEIISLYDHFREGGMIPIELGCEEVAAQKFLRQTINEYRPDIQIRPMRPDKDKTRRLIDVSRYYEYGTVSLMTQSFVDELLSFPSGDKDRVDASVWCLKMYEQDNPLIVDGRYTELDQTIKMSDNDLEVYSELAYLGIPGHHLPTEKMVAYEDAMAIQEYFDDLC